MNPLFLKSLAAAFSLRKELTYVIFTFLLVLLIPVIAVILLTQSGIDIVSERLATINPQNNAVQIRNPATGEIIKEIQVTTAWPTTGVITLEFGEPDLPFMLFHNGIDIANPTGQIGDPVTPFMDGTVTFAGEKFWGYGKYITIDHGDNISSLYGHLDKIYVIKGQKVTLGQVIAREGSTGWSTGPHLHFTIKVFGIPVNPRTFLGNGDPV